MEAVGQLSADRSVCTPYAACRKVDNRVWCTVLERRTNKKNKKLARYTRSTLLTVTVEFYSIALCLKNVKIKNHQVIGRAGVPAGGEGILSVGEVTSEGPPHGEFAK